MIACRRLVAASVITFSGLKVKYACASTEPRPTRPRN